MKVSRAVAIGALLVATSVSQATASEATSNNLALLVEAQSRLDAQITTASVHKGSSQYTLLAERRQLDEMIAALETGEDVAPDRIERALKRARVLR